MNKSPGRIQSFKYVLNGILTLLRTQPNARIHALATLVVCAAGAYFKLQRSEWCWIILAIAFVWMAEAFNTALEFLADAVNPTYHPLVGKAKDVAAGAVLISAIGAAVIGGIVFWPYVLASIHRLCPVT